MKHYIYYIIMIIFKHIQQQIIHEHYDRFTYWILNHEHYDRFTYWILNHEHYDRFTYCILNHEHYD